MAEQIVFGTATYVQLTIVISVGVFVGNLFSNLVFNNSETNR